MHERNTMKYATALFFLLPLNMQAIGLKPLPIRVTVTCGANSVEATATTVDEKGKEKFASKIEYAPQRTCRFFCCRSGNKDRSWMALIPDINVKDAPADNLNFATNVSKVMHAAIKACRDTDVNDELTGKWKYKNSTWERKDDGKLHLLKSDPAA